MTDEGLAGVGVHVANDAAEPLTASLRIGLYADCAQRVGEAQSELSLGAHDAVALDLETLLGRFADASWTYRFGPPAQDLIVASLEREGELLSQALHFPAGRPAAVESPQRLGLEASARRDGDGAVAISLSSERLVYGLRLAAPGLEPGDDAFSLEPGAGRIVGLRICSDVVPSSIALTALNMRGRVTVPVQG
jgi:beta-mannosidase